MALCFLEAGAEAEQAEAVRSVVCEIRAFLLLGACLPRPSKLQFRHCGLEHGTKERCGCGLAAFNGDASASIGLRSVTPLARLAAL